MKDRAPIISLFEMTGWTQTTTPSDYLDDETLDVTKEVFFTIATSNAKNAFSQMVQILKQQNQKTAENK